MIGIISAGGNIKNISNMLKFLGCENIIEVKNPTDLQKIDILFFPGVGNFGSTINKLHKADLFHPLKKYLNSNKIYVGICLGMQILFNSSEEDKSIVGLGHFKGNVLKIKSELNYLQMKIPNVGWRSTNLENSNYLKQLFNKNFIKTYYMHSFAIYENNYINDLDYSFIDYGNKKIISSLIKKNIYAFQFHPEKSSSVGLKLLRSILKKNKK